VVPTWGVRVNAYPTPMRECYAQGEYSVRNRMRREKEIVSISIPYMGIDS